MAKQLEDVYCTLLMSDSYLPGATVLAHSLRDAGTKKKLACLVTLATLTADTIGQLKSLYDYVIPVERIRSPNPANLFLMDRSDLLYAFTKIALWRQTQFRKIVYLDADVVALRALDELFDIEAPFAAAPDIGWPDAFNTGVMVLNPDMGEYWALQTMAAAGDSFDGADQGLLNQYYEHKDWHRLKFTYNCTPNAQYQWEPAYRYYKRDISAVHFIGKNKPWSSGRTGGGGFGTYNELLARWWAVHDKHFREAKDSTSGENISADLKTSSTHHLGPVEIPFSEPGEEVENIDQGIIEPTPTVEQRRFSAPQMEWDATKSEPPAESKPEAANFPTQTYAFSDSHQLFQAPQNYPEPPKDMWYKVPEEPSQPTEQPKPIFPWERVSDRPKATRVFAEDFLPKPAQPQSSQPQPQPTHPFSTIHYEQDEGRGKHEAAALELSESVRTLSIATADEQWQAYQDTSTNAWDTVPGIDTYVRTIMDQQTRRGKTQVLHQSSHSGNFSQLGRSDRRESLILTDFPSAVERPSLPVTPAPLARPTFWGQERDEQGELPQAEGVPSQAEWVCPQCGFSSSSTLDFTPIEQLRTASVAAAVASMLQVPVKPSGTSEDQSESAPRHQDGEGATPGSAHLER